MEDPTRQQKIDLIRKLMDRALEAIERDYQEAMAKIYFSKDWGPKEEEEDH